jgi:hypothetical protein
MKKRSITLLAYGLAMMFVLYNCKKKEEPFPLEPDTAVANELNAIAVAPITLVQPAAVTTTPAGVVASAQATAAYPALGPLASGTVPATVQATANEVAAVGLSTAEVTKVEGITTQQIAAVSGGGAVPADLKVILDKMANNTALQAYLPKLTFPTVNGTTISGGRTGAVESVEKGEGIEVEDACVLAAVAVFDGVKVKLDASKAAELAKVTAAFQAAIAPLAGQEVSCKSGVPAKYDPFRVRASAVRVQGLADIEAAKSKIPVSLYSFLKVFVNFQTMIYLASLNTLQAADLKACSEKTKASTTAITAARTANTAAANAAYAAALALAQTKKQELVLTCHNQGGGK